MTFSDIVVETRKQYGLTVADFLAGINSYLPPDEQYTLQMMYLWERGKHEPNLTRVDYIRRYAPEGSWQRAFAAAGVDYLAYQGDSNNHTSNLSGQQSPVNGITGEG